MVLHNTQLKSVVFARGQIKLPLRFGSVTTKKKSQKTSRFSLDFPTVAFSIFSFQPVEYDTPNTVFLSYQGKHAVFWFQIFGVRVNLFLIEMLQVVQRRKPEWTLLGVGGKVEHVINFLRCQNHSDS